MIFRARIFSVRGQYIYAHGWSIYYFYRPFILRENIVYFQRRDRIFLKFEDCIFKPTVYFKPRTVYFQLKDRFFQPWPYILLTGCLPRKLFINSFDLLKQRDMKINMKMAKKRIFLTLQFLRTLLIFFERLLITENLYCCYSLIGVDFNPLRI